MRSLITKVNFMNSKLIKSKAIHDGTLDLFEFSDVDGIVVSYSVVKGHSNANGSHHGGGKMEDAKFSNKEDAITFFDDQS